MKKYTILLLLLGLTATFANAQFPIKIPKVKVPKVEQPKTESTPQPNNPIQTNKSNNSQDNKSNLGDGLGRQMVMDDGVTFFDAEPIAGRDPKTNREIDTGWFLKSHLRIFGTFPKRSAFRIAVKKNGKELSSTRCEGEVLIKREKYTQRLELFNLDFEDYMSTDKRCYDKEQVVKEIGKLDVEIYFVDGDTDKETLVRTHKIDVRKAERFVVSNSVLYPGVSQYYIQRHAESAVAIAFFSTGSAINHSYYESNPSNFVSKYRKNETTFENQNNIKLGIYTSFSPDGTKGMPGKPFARCTVNGQKVNFSNDSVDVAKNLDRREMAASLKSGVGETVEFTGLAFILPIYLGNDKSYYRTDETPDGKWECAIVENGVTFRTFRFEIKDGYPAQHPEQQNSNINLFYRTSLVDMEIPTGGSRFDFRLMPTADLFYGILWSTPEGKAMAARVPKKGNPFITIAK